LAPLPQTCTAPPWLACRRDQRKRWPRPQPAQAAWGLRLEREDGDGAGWVGGMKLR